MSQSTTNPASTGERAVLFQCSNELAEFATLFAELAMPVHECVGDVTDPTELEGARLAVVSGRRLLEGRTRNLDRWPRTIAVVDDASKTLVTHLGRMGVAMVIRRPIHPHALRLLLLHEIYRGPERRVRKRVLIGHPIRIASGLFRPKALLLELSPTGARIELAHAPKVGSRIRILLGRDLTHGKPLKLQARVVRCIRPSNRKDRAEAEIGVVLLDAPSHARTIRAILDRFALGPAKWHAKTGAPTSASGNVGAKSRAQSLPPAHRSEAPQEQPRYEEDTRRDAESQVEETGVDEIDARQALHLGSEPKPTNGPEPVESEEIERGRVQYESDLDSEENSDRRCGTRIAYDKRVVALSEEAARVLVGRDLSEGGMRIEPTPVVRVGDKFRVALHSGARSEPLVVIANALRDDGDDGVVLTFEDLSANQIERLSAIIRDGLPVHATADEFEADDEGQSIRTESIVVAEMLETLSPQSDAEIAAHLDSVFDTSESVEDAR